jgi:ATP-binding cassette subfamily F protein 3
MLEKMVKIAPAHVDSRFQFKFHDPEKQPQQLMQLEDVTVGYGQTTVVDDFRLRLGAGDRIGLLGSNGADKSTLVKTLVNGGTLLSGERTVNKHAHSGYFAQQQLELLRMDESPLWHVQHQSPDAREQELRNNLGRFGFQGDRITDPVAPFPVVRRPAWCWPCWYCKSPTCCCWMSRPTTSTWTCVTHSAWP